MKRRLKELHNRVRPHWRRYLSLGICGLLIIATGAQLLYPSNRLVPFSSVDGISLGGWQKNDATKSLDSAYAKKIIPVYFGQAKKAYRSPETSEIGLSVSNKIRVDKSNYPWYLRIIPTSILWAHFITESKSEPEYQRSNDKLTAYINKELGNSCNIEPQDASLRLSGVAFKVIPSQNGGICDIGTARQALSSVRPRLNVDGRVNIPVKEVAPGVSDEAARKLGDYLQKKAVNGVSITVNGVAQTIPASDLFSWIDFSASDSQLNYTFNRDRSLTYLNKEIAPKVAVNSGTTTVSTYDFVETARVDGANGKRLDINATLDNLKLFIAGDIGRATAITEPVPPRVIYTRSYSPTDVGLSALIQRYAQEHTGTFGISMIELSGRNRRASYNDTKLFTTASTYKLFVAYSTLKRIEDGSWNWSDQINNGRDLSVCFDDMIVKSDNACGAALLAKIGYINITNEVHAIGCTNTSFLGKDSIKTTSADLALFMAELQTGQMLTQQSSRDRLIDALKRNIYRQGIPAGVSGEVADKVGFMDGLFHDAAIVYSPTGTYVLAIMTDGSNWATVADLAGKIEALRSQ